tara:strand:- start:861 stop:1151 length:291 start_codon:yes stop_codon:yes gene_type:complete
MDRQELLEESIANVTKDRQLTLDLLNELRQEITSGETTHGRSGNVAAKYVETLQRSNEQLVKLINLIQKDHKGEYVTTLDDKETESIFELIQAGEG